MNEVLLVLTLYCGVPVSATLTYPENGVGVVRVFAVEADKRQAFLDLEAQLKGVGANVARVHVEKQVEGVKCGVST